MNKLIRLVSISLALLVLWNIDKVLAENIKDIAQYSTKLTQLKIPEDDRL